MTTMQATRVTLWLVESVPVALLHHGLRWRVIDKPTALGNEDAVFSGIITHPPAPWTGWRFSARSESDGDVLTFDVRQSGDGWDLIRTYR